VKVREIQRAKEAKIAIFDHPTLISHPLSSEPREYPHEAYVARNDNDPWATVLLLIVWVYFHANFSGWLRNTCV